MTTYTNAVETVDLTREFGDFVAVNKVNFYIPRGEIFGLLGPNGAGKTTTIRMLCGIITPTAGNATVLGFDIRKEASQIKKRIGYMSQRFSLYDDLTAVENLGFYAAIYGVPNGERKKRIQDLMSISGLRGYENELTRNLSGAWRQRLALACAIAHRPPMLFLDEATAGVDPVSRREFWDLIYEMAAEGTSILATTHYMDEAEYCNTIGMMYQSQLVALASPDTLKDNLSGLLLQITCADSLLGEKTAKKIPGVKEAALHGVRLHVSVRDKEVVPLLQAAFSQAQIPITEIELIQPSLEDVFISIVEGRMLQNGTLKQGGV